MAKTPDLVVTIHIDTTAIVRELRKAAVAAEHFAEAMAGVARLIGAATTTTVGYLAQRRALVAGNGRDAITHPEMWQSAVCAAWLHDSCPSDRSHLSCTCTCHRRADR